jgi:hypothetical protein
MEGLDVIGLTDLTGLTGFTSYTPLSYQDSISILLAYSINPIKLIKSVKAVKSYNIRTTKLMKEEINEKKSYFLSKTGIGFGGKGQGGYSLLTFNY